MKTLVRTFFVVCALSLAACGEKSTDGNISPDIVGAPEGKEPIMTFEKDVHDFGTIKEGEVVSMSFPFKNTGGSDLVITNASGSCGCTDPKFPTEPIRPGEEGKITVAFNSEGKPNKQEKTVTIISNEKNKTKVLRIKGNVIPKSAPANP